MFLLLLRNLLFLLQILVLEGKALIVFPTLFTPFSVWTFYIEMPAIPFLKPTAIQKYLLLLHLLLLLGFKNNRGLYLSVDKVCEIDFCEEGMFFDFLGILIEP